MPIPLVTDPPARAGTRPAAIPQETPMTHERHFPNEDPATTHARLSAAVVAAHANACAAADAFLSGSVPPDLRQMPPELKLTRNEAGRVAVIDTGTPDEREFTSHEALRAYVRRCVVMSLTVRRDGWTLPDPEDARIEPDSARLLLRPGNPVVDIVARIGMDPIARRGAPALQGQPRPDAALRSPRPPARRPRRPLRRQRVHDMTRPTAAVTIGNTSIDVEHDEKLIKALLAEGNDQVQIDLEDVSDEHIDTLFGSLMQSAMASGGRRLAIEWMKRLDVPGNAGERARHAMAQTINLQLQFGMLSPPLAEQAGCRTELHGSPSSRGAPTVADNALDE